MALKNHPQAVRLAGDSFVIRLFFLVPHKFSAAGVELESVGIYRPLAVARLDRDVFQRKVAGQGKCFALERNAVTVAVDSQPRVFLLCGKLERAEINVAKQRYRIACGRRICLYNTAPASISAR